MWQKAVEFLLVKLRWKCFNTGSVNSLQDTAESVSGLMCMEFSVRWQYCVLFHLFVCHTRIVYLFAVQ